MSNFKYSYPIDVRYGDLDPQGHVNNANFLTFFEQSRINYFVNLGLFTKSSSFLNVGFIMADAQVTFLAPVLFGMDVRVHLGITHLGNKSMKMEYVMRDEASDRDLAKGSTVLVTYDYHHATPIPIPDLWRETISAFEGLVE